LENIVRPQLVVDKNKCQNNIRRMAEKAKSNNLKFRPHFKTHQSEEIGEIYRQQGIKCITVSSLEMASFFAERGWEDITVAFPVNIREIETINSLNKIITLNLLVESVESIQYLDHNTRQNINVFVKIDTGYHRTGIRSSNKEYFRKVLIEIQQSDKVNFKGLLVHSGHTYNAKTIQDISDIHKSSLFQLAELKKISEEYFEDFLISIGDTPSCSLMKDFEGVDEIRPGNFVFYDLMQYYIGSCNFDQIATIMACPVVAKHKGRKEVIIHGGAIHFSKDYITVDSETDKVNQNTASEKVLEIIYPDKYEQITEDRQYRHLPGGGKVFRIRSYGKAHGYTHVLEWVVRIGGRNGYPTVKRMYSL